MMVYRRLSDQIRGGPALRKGHAVWSYPYCKRSGGRHPQPAQEHREGESP